MCVCMSFVLSCCLSFAVFGTLFLVFIKICVLYFVLSVCLSVFLSFVVYAVRYVCLSLVRVFCHCCVSVCFSSGGSFFLPFGISFVRSLVRSV